MKVANCSQKEERKIHILSGETFPTNKSGLFFKEKEKEKNMKRFHDKMWK